MLSILPLYVILSYISLILADIHQHPIQNQEPVSLPHKRVAIIGAGAGGTSLSYHLRKYVSELPEPVPLHITIFDRNPYIGGRTTTVNAFSLPQYPVELGGSIFVTINEILYNATRDFNLTSSVNIYEKPADAKYELGIWDGTSFVFKVEQDDDDRSSARGWWEIVKLIWRYGLAPIRTQRVTKAAVSSFLNFYRPPVFPFSSLQEAIEDTGLLDYTSITGTEVLNNAGVSEKFSREIVQASTRVNYASNLDSIHGLETLVCMAIEGANAVEGGNWQIFDTMAKLSADRIFLNTTVTEVVRDEVTKKFHLVTLPGSESFEARFLAQEIHEEAYDTVVLATPYQFSNLTISPPLISPPKPIPYVGLHVTLLATPHRLSPSFFNLADPEDVPSSVLTTLPPPSSSSSSSSDGPNFFSISTLRVLTDVPFYPNQPQYLYKFFSPAPLRASWLAQVFDIPYSSPTSSSSSSTSSSDDDDYDPITNLPTTAITWHHHKLWHSYPVETPRREFENFEFALQTETKAKTDTDTDTSRDAGIWYLSGMESFISTMETSALAGMNVARLIVDRW